MTIKQTIDDRPYLIFERSSIKQWPVLPDEDKKVLAALYWEELTDTQKEDFSNAEYIEFIKLKEKQHEELVNDPVKMRRKFLVDAAPLVDQMVGKALGKGKATLVMDELATKEVWSILKGIIESANNPAPLLDLKGQSIDSQIDLILGKVSTGDIDFEQAKEYMSLVSSGFNLQKLPQMLAQLEKLEASA